MTRSDRASIIDPGQVPEHLVEALQLAKWALDDVRAVVEVARTGQRGCISPERCGLCAACQSRPPVRPSKFLERARGELESFDQDRDLFLERVDAFLDAACSTLLVEVLRSGDSAVQGIDIDVDGHEASSSSVAPASPLDTAASDAAATASLPKVGRPADTTEAAAVRGVSAGAPASPGPQIDHLKQDAEEIVHILDDCFPTYTSGERWAAAARLMQLHDRGQL